jgi:hypothetical protein
MKTVLITLLTLWTVPALAHIEAGAHKGKTPAGEDCLMKVGRSYFNDNFHHPLNERIEVSVNGVDFVVGHPPVISVNQQIVYFDHDRFQGVKATPTGAQGLEITMKHTATEEGPTEFHFITHDYAKNERQVQSCRLL